MILIFYAIFKIFLSEGKSIVAFYEDEPYISLEASLFSDLLPMLMKDLNETWESKKFDSEDEALNCVKEGDCEFTLSGFDSKVSLSYPVFTETFVLISKDKRESYLKSLLWQYLVLILTIWLPALIIVSHYNFIFETGPAPYNIRIFKAICYNFSVQDLKKPFSKAMFFITWMLLSLILLIILADLSSIIASANSYNSSVLTSSDYSDTCSTFDLIPYSASRSIDKCIDELESSEVSYVIIGKLQLNQVSKHKLSKYIVRESSLGPQFFHLSLPPGSDTSNYDKILQKYWRNHIISSVTSKYSPESFRSSNHFSLFFQDFYLIFTGMSVLALFALVLLFFKCFGSRFNKNLKSEPSEPSPSSRSLLARIPSHTLSLDISGYNRVSQSRPDEWINRAVDIQDDNAHKFKNIQDYENELSAVEQVHPSNMTDRSLLSIMKSVASK